MFSRAQRAFAAFSFVAPARLVVRILGADCERDAAACGELRGHDRFAGRAGFDEIVEDTVRDRFVERALVPIRSQIKFERFTLDAETIGHVIDIDPGKIGLARDRTNGSEIIRFKMNLITAAGRRIRESLKPRLGGRCGNLCFSSPE